jgi:peptidoglycan/LPS O-acetylase OafA/YrhL
MKTYADNNYIEEIDHLRGVAIILTLFAHLAFMQGNPSKAYLYIVNNIAQFWGGVHLFFVVSGYVISRSFMHDFEYAYAPTRADFMRQWMKFYIRRFFRIIPTAMTWIVMTLLFSQLFNSHGSFGPPHSVFVQALAASLFVYNVFIPSIGGAAFGVFWSLSFEEQFYLLFPLFSRNSEKSKLVVLVAVIVVFTHIHRPANQHLIMVSFPLDAICWGVLLAMAQRNGWLKGLQPTFLENPWARLINLVVAVAVLTVSAVLLRDFTFGTSFLELSAAWLVFCASFDKGYISPFGMTGTLFKSFGKVSFSLYCAHIPAFLLTRESLLSLGEVYTLSSEALNWIAPVIAAILCTVFTVLSVNLVERPSRQYGRRLTEESYRTSRGRNPLPQSLMSPHSSDLTSPLKP